MRTAVAIDPLGDNGEVVMETCFLGRRFHGFKVASESAPANGWVRIDYDPEARVPVVRKDNGVPLRIARFVEIGPFGMRAIPD